MAACSLGKCGRICSVTIARRKVGRLTRIKGARFLSLRGPLPARRGHLHSLLQTAPISEPHFVEPMKCKLVETLPRVGKWHYELKLDGYRALAIKNGSKVTLISRNQKELLFPEIAHALAKLRCEKATLDGEIVALDESGWPSFQALQNIHAPTTSPRPLLYYLFDLINYEGRDLSGWAIEERRRLLTDLLKQAVPGIRLSKSVEGSSDAILEQVKAK